MRVSQDQVMRLASWQTRWKNLFTRKIIHTFHQCMTILSTNMTRKKSMKILTSSIQRNIHSNTTSGLLLFLLRQGFEDSITQFSNPARCELEIRDGENLRQWSWLKISHNFFVGQPFRKNSSSPSIHNNETFFNLLQSGFFFIFSNVSACFMPLFSFYIPWKHQKTRGLMMFSGRIERGQWYGMLSWF